MSKLPTQLKWSQFVRALTNLKYQQLKSKSGSARHFQRTADGEILTFHEPHGGATLKQGTLTEYLRHMKVNREEFKGALSGAIEVAAMEEERRYRRTVRADGPIISNCTRCFNVVGESTIEEEVIAAELSHPCYSNCRRLDGRGFPIFSSAMGGPNRAPWPASVARKIDQRKCLRGPCRSARTSAPGDKTPGR